MLQVRVFLEIAGWFLSWWVLWSYWSSSSSHTGWPVRPSSIQPRWSFFLYLFVWLFVYSFVAFVWLFDNTCCLHPHIWAGQPGPHQPGPGGSFLFVFLVVCIKLSVCLFVWLIIEVILHTVLRAGQSSPHQPSPGGYSFFPFLVCICLFVWPYPSFFILAYGLASQAFINPAQVDLFDLLNMFVCLPRWIFFLFFLFVFVCLIIVVIFHPCIWMFQGIPLGFFVFLGVPLCSNLSLLI